MSTTRSKLKLMGFYCSTGFYYYTWSTQYNLALTTQSLHSNAYTTDFVTIGSTTSTTQTPIGNVTFIYPNMLGYESLIDGVATGFITIDFYNSVNGNLTQVDEITVQLLKLYSNGSSSVVASADNLTTTSLTWYNDTSHPEGYFFLLNIEDVTYNYDTERIGIKVLLEGHVNGGTGSYYMRMTKNSDDLFIYIPYV